MWLTERKLNLIIEKTELPEMDLEYQPEDSPGAYSTLTDLNCLLFLGRSPSLTESFLRCRKWGREDLLLPETGYTHPQNILLERQF